MPSGLNAEPGAVLEFPGLKGWSSHDWFGCPAATVPTLAKLSKSAKTSTKLTITAFFMTVPPIYTTDLF